MPLRHSRRRNPPAFTTIGAAHAMLQQASGSLYLIAYTPAPVPPKISRFLPSGLLLLAGALFS